MATNQPVDQKRSALAAALEGGPRRNVAPRAEGSFDKEVDEDLQREQLARLWDEYSAVIVAAAVALVLAVGGFKLIQHRREVAADTAGAQYIAAIKDLTTGKTDAAKTGLDSLAKGSSGFATLAKLRLAAADAAAGKTADAVAAYTAIAADRSADPLLSSFARLQTAMLSVDTASWDDMQGRLQGLTDDGSAWRYSARELLGMAALKAGKTAEARTVFEKLASDPAVPPGIAERARIVMGSIVAADMAVTPTAVATPAAATTTPASKVPAPGPTAQTAPAPTTPGPKQ